MMVEGEWQPGQIIPDTSRALLAWPSYPEADPARANTSVVSGSTVAIPSSARTKEASAGCWRG